MNYIETARRATCPTSRPEPRRRKRPLAAVTAGPVDRWVLDRLPVRDLPDILFDHPSLDYPAQLNAADALLGAALRRGWGERIAYRTADAVWTYAALAETAGRIAAILTRQLHLIPGNRVMLHGANTPMLVACWFGILQAGGVVVTTMPLLRAGELAVLIERAGIDLAFCEAGLTTELLAAAALVRPGLRIVDYGTGELDRMIRDEAPAAAAVPTLAVDPALIAFTSGTTGDPKATVHLHRDILAVADCFPVAVLGVRADDVFLCSAPMSFTFGLGAHVMFPIRHGASAILLPRATPDLLFEAIEAFRPTIVMTAPTAYRVMLNRLATARPTPVRAWVSAGEHLPPATFEAWRDATGASIVNGIGSTEMLHIFVSTRLDEHKSGSTGRAVQGYRATIIDPDGNEVPPGTVGRLAVKGPTGCRYLADRRQAAYVVNGWNVTGDAYVQDEEGFFWFRGRTDDMIVSAGYNIAGPEVEEAVMRHRAVLECAVVGVPDEARGQLVKAFIRLRPGHAPSPDLARDIQDFVKTAIAPFKYPRAIAFLDDFPRNASGKILRSALRG